MGNYNRDRLHGLPPLMDARTRVLILGSFPSAASLAAQQYYAHKQNQFWKILGVLLALPLPAMNYAERQVAVLAAGVGVWDVFAACTREGSLDAAIRAGKSNDFSQLKKSAPALRRVCFNGQTAGRFVDTLQASGYETLVLPSTSPANATWSFERKLAAWREGLDIPGIDDP